MKNPDLVSQKVHEKLRKMLKERRLSMGWSQATVAEQAGLARKAVSFLEDGIRQPKLDTLLRVSGALEIRLSDYLRECEE